MGLRRLGGTSRHAAAWRVVVLAAVLAAFAALGSSPQPAAGAQACAVAPVVRDTNVSQGIGGTNAAGYSPLVRGKDTLVRFYVSNPSCSSSQLQILDGSLSATIKNNAGTTVGTIGPFSTINRYAADANGNFPVVSTYTAAPVAADTTSDPKFVVPGYRLVSSDSNAFTVTWTLSGHFRIGTTGASTAFGGGSTYQTTSSFDKKTRALRVLVVKMGDPNGIPLGGVCPTGATCTTYGASQHPEFSNAAISATQNAFAALSRSAPVPGGGAAGAAATGDLAGTNGGVRYTFNLASSCSPAAVTCGMLNLAALTDANGNSLLSPANNFCGGGGNFSLIQPQLTAVLNAWNAANPTATADRVLGVVDGSVSNGPNNGCAGGMAAFNSKEAWVRVDPAAANTGAILSMELGHTLGVVPSARSRTGSLYHSRFTESDQYVDSRGNVVDPNRAYNDMTRSYLPTDRTVMYASDANWTTDNVDYEAADYGAIRCQLGGSTTSDCTTSGTVGTGTGVAASSHFSLAGSVGPADTTADVTQSYFSQNSVFPTPDPSATSNYHLVQRGSGGGIVRNDPLPASCDTSDHDNLDLSGGLPGAIEHPSCYFAASVDFDATTASQIELWRGAPPSGTPCASAGSTSGGSTCLYVREQQGVPTTSAQTDAGPVGSARNYTHDATIFDTEPALSPNGNWVAWTRNEGVLVDSRKAKLPESTGVGVPNPTADEFPTESDPAWSADGTELAYVLDGNVYVVGVTFPSNVPIFGTPTLVYDAFAADGGGAHNPTFNRAGTKIAFDDSFDVYTVNADGSTSASPTLAFSGAIEPSWSHVPGDNRIAFERDVSCGFECSQAAVWLGLPGTTGIEFVEEASNPSFGPDGRIAFETFGGLCTPDSTDCLDSVGGIHSMRPLASGEADLSSDIILVEAGDGFAGQPSYTGSDVAYIGPNPGNSADDDVFIQPLDVTGATVTFTAPPGADPSLYRLSLFYSCNGLDYPVTLDLVPGGVSGATATFNPRFDASFACTGGTLVLKGNDGFTEFDVPVTGPTALSGFDQDPVVAINSPADGKHFLQFSDIPLNVSAKDAEDGELSGSSIDLEITDPHGLTTDVGNGNVVDLPNAALPFNDAGGHGWITGTYTLTATATDSAGNTDTASARFFVAADANDDGIADSSESACGISTTNPAAAFSDKDGDGIPNIDDPHLCVADTPSDTTAPRLTVTNTPPTNANGQVGAQPVTVNVAASDAGGLRAVSCSLDGGPVTLPGGDTVWASQSYAGSFPVSGYGKHQISCSATDEAYNSTSASDTVWIVYQFIGFLQPVDNLPAVNVGTAGKTYPVKWQLKGTNGAFVSDLTTLVDANGNPTTNLASKTVKCKEFTLDPKDALETSTSGGSTFGYDATTKQFIYNWQTPSTVGCYELFARLADGTVHQANFQLK